MRITSLVENTSKNGLPVEHGLSLFIALNDGRNILFDMGQGRLLADNAKSLGLSIAAIDTAVISHGHYDHGGGLQTFLALNNKAKIYVNKQAFEPHYSQRDNGMSYIGMDAELKDNECLVYCDALKEIDHHVTVFADVRGDCCRPIGNKRLFGPIESINDSFTHEQNMIVEENGNMILFAGCAHCGIVNIIRKAEQLFGKTPTHVFAGMHLVKSGLNETDENAFIQTLANELKKYKNCKFYTMHCTGTEQYKKMKDLMHDQIAYLSCGDTMNI